MNIHTMLKFNALSIFRAAGFAKGGENGTGNNWNGFTSKNNIKQYNKKDSSSCELNDDDDTCSDKDCLIAHRGSFC